MCVPFSWHAKDEHVKQPLINDTIDLVEPMEFDRRSFAEVLHRRVEKKSATGSAAGRQQLDLDLHAILKGLDGRKNCWFKYVQVSSISFKINYLLL
jgi:hypothetical protein